MNDIENIEEITQQQDRLINFALNNPVFSNSVPAEAIAEVAELARSKIQNYISDSSRFDNSDLVYILPVIDDADFDDLFILFRKMGVSPQESLIALRSMAFREFYLLKGNTSEYALTEYQQVLNILHKSIIRIASYARKHHSLGVAKSLEDSPESLEIFREVIASKSVDMGNNQVQQ